MKSEPAVIVSTLTAFLTAIIGLAVAFGADITGEQQNAILTVLGPAVAIIALVGPVIRQFVWAPNTVKQVKAESVKAGETGGSAPIVP
jgi:hypothetical protein